MEVTQAPAATHAAFELRFTSMFDAGRALAFPCDAAGRVDLDGLSEPARNNYFYARAMAGHEFAWPAVQARRSPAGLAQRIRYTNK
jgi:hypothetical protein